MKWRVPCGDANVETLWKEYKEGHVRPPPERCETLVTSSKLRVRLGSSTDENPYILWWKSWRRRWVSGRGRRQALQRGIDAVNQGWAYTSYLLKLRASLLVRNSHTSKILRYLYDALQVPRPGRNRRKKGMV